MVLSTPWKREDIRSYYSVRQCRQAGNRVEWEGWWARTDQSLQLQLASSVRCGVDLIFLARIPAAACSDLAWSWPFLWAVAVPQRIYQQVASLDCAFLHPFSSLLFVPFSLFCWWCRSKCGWNQSFLAVAEQQLSASFHTTILLLPICHGVRTGTSSWTENVRNDRTFGWWASPSNQNEPPPNGWFLLDMDVSSEFWRNMPSVFNSMRKQAARKIS